MSDQGDDELSGQTRELLRAGAAADEPSAADRERVRAALALKLAAAAGAGAAASAASSAQAASTAAAAGAGAGAGLAVKITVVAALVGVAGSGAWWLARDGGEPSRLPPPPSLASAPAPADLPEPPPAMPSPSVDAGDGISVPVPPPSNPPRQAPAAPRVQQQSPAPPAGPTALERETAALRGVRADLRAGRAEAALAGLDAYARDFSGGLLAEEAAALRVDVLCALGRADEAARAAEAFLARHPRSPHAARVERVCQGEVSP